MTNIELDWREALHALEEKVNNLAVQIQALYSSMMPRAEILSEDMKRVTRENFDATMQGVNERIERLEAHPARMLGWLSLLISSGVGCLSILIAATGIIIVVATHITLH